MTIWSDAHEFKAAVTMSGALDLTNVTLTPPTNQAVLRRYVSQTITHADLTAGATCSVALTGEPTGWIPIAAYVVTTEDTEITGSDTVGFTVTVGEGSSPSAYLASILVAGTAGRKQGAMGSYAGRYRASDALVANFTAAGTGSEDCADVTRLGLKVVIFYITPPTE